MYCSANLSTLLLIGLEFTLFLSILVAHIYCCLILQLRREALEKELITVVGHVRAVSELLRLLHYTNIILFILLLSSCVDNRIHISLHINDRQAVLCYLDIVSDFSFCNLCWTIGLVKSWISSRYKKELAFICGESAPVFKWNAACVCCCWLLLLLLCCIFFPESSVELMLNDGPWCYQLITRLIVLEASVH